jgi:hypothetical protein
LKPDVPAKPLEKGGHGIAERGDPFSFRDSHFTFDQRSSKRRCDVLRIAPVLYLGALAETGSVVDELNPVDGAALENVHQLLLALTEFFVASLFLRIETKCLQLRLQYSRISRVTANGFLQSGFLQILNSSPAIRSRETESKIPSIAYLSFKRCETTVVNSG